MCGFASPKGEIAKTSCDRIKKSIQHLRDTWQVEDKEFNAVTIRAYRHDTLHAEVFRFSLAQSTSNESKSLNLLIVDEAHKADDQKRSDQLDPMLAASNGSLWLIGVGNPRLCDFYNAVNGQLPNTTVVRATAEDVIRDRRRKFDETGDPIHLAYEHAFEAELRKKGRQNPEIRRNYYLEDTVEEGNFASRERLLSCARGPDVVVSMEKLFFGIDWARVSDYTWVAISNDQNDIITWFKYPHLPYEQQIELMLADLKKPIKATRTKDDGSNEEYEWTLFERIVGVKGDSTGQGDMPMEFLQMHSGLPVGDDSHVKFTLQSKNDLYVNFENAIFRDAGDKMRFSYPADHPLAAEFEEQTTKLIREYKGDGEYLSVHHPDEPDAKDDAPDGTALTLFAVSNGGIGNILFV